MDKKNGKKNCSKSLDNFSSCTLSDCLTLNREWWDSLSKCGLKLSLGVKVVVIVVVIIGIKANGTWVWNGYNILNDVDNESDDHPRLWFVYSIEKVSIRQFLFRKARYRQKVLISWRKSVFALFVWWSLFITKEKERRLQKYRENNQRDDDELGFIS